MKCIVINERIDIFISKSYLLSDVVLCFAGDLISQTGYLIFSFNCLEKAKTPIINTSLMAWLPKRQIHGINLYICIILLSIFTIHVCSSWCTSIFVALSSTFMLNVFQDSCELLSWVQLMKWWAMLSTPGDISLSSG